MSTDLDQGEGGLRELHSEADLEGWFASGAKPRERWGIGLEYERLGVFVETGQAIPYSGERSVSALLEELVREEGWLAVREGAHPIALTRAGSAITLEPGGQTELSSRIHTDLAAMRDELCAFVRNLNQHSASRGIAWIGLGLQPFTLREAIPWVPKARYGIMSAHLGRTGRLAHDMMKRTAGIQVNFDYASEADAAAKFRALMAHSAVITALFANSPLSGGEPTGFMSTRAAIWMETDPARCGLLELAFADRPFFQAYLDYALDVPCMFVVRDGRWRDVGGKTFRRFLREGHEGLAARQSDWELHLTTLFPDVRMKRFLEARFADSGDASLAMAQVALIKGIVYDEVATAAAWDLVRDLTWQERLALHRDAARHGLEARAGRRPLHALAADLVQVARAGLERQAAGGGANETGFLAPLDVILGDGESPARRLLRLWEQDMGRDPRRLVAHLSSVNIDCYTC